MYEGLTYRGSPDRRSKTHRSRVSPFRLLLSTSALVLWATLLPGCGSTCVLMTDVIQPNGSGQYVVPLWVHEENSWFYEGEILENPQKAQFCPKPSEAQSLLPDSVTVTPPRNEVDVGSIALIVVGVAVGLKWLSSRQKKTPKS